MIPVWLMALPWRTIGRVAGVLAIVTLLVAPYVAARSYRQQRDEARDDVQRLEQDVDKLRSINAEWVAYSDRVAASLYEAQARAAQLMIDLDVVRRQVTARDHELRRRASELADARAETVTATECREAWGQALAAVGW